MNAIEEVRKRRLLINRLDQWLYDEIQPYIGQRILEVGCGHGNMAEHFLDRQLFVATDIDPQSVAIVTKKFRDHSNVKTMIFDVTKLPCDELQKCVFDTIVSLNLLEHIQDDCTALSNLYMLLQPGGNLVLILPAFHLLYGTMDSSIGHYRRYTKQSIRERLARCNFQVSHQCYLNFLGAFGWFVNGRIIKRTVPPTGQLKWFNALVPLIKMAEHIVQPPIGLSLISVSQKV